jgi:hypothetical protein
MLPRTTSANTVCRRPPEDALVDGRGWHDRLSHRGPGRPGDLPRQLPGTGRSRVPVENLPTDMGQAEAEPKAEEVAEAPTKRRKA